MDKDAYYFSHDSNAKDDEKIIALRMKHDWKGYGLFWAIIEKLRDSTGFMLSINYNLIAYDLRADSALIKSIICDFGLFAFTENGECFYSKRLMKSMEFVESKSNKAKKAAGVRWDKERNANAMRTHSDSNAIKGKESKENEKKENDNEQNLPPSSSHFSNPLLDSLIQKTVEECQKEYFNSTAWVRSREQLCISEYQSPEQLLALSIEFNGHLIVSGTVTKDMKDWVKHFSNWIKNPNRKAAQEKTNQNATTETAAERRQRLLREQASANTGR